MAATEASRCHPADDAGTFAANATAVCASVPVCPVCPVCRKEDAFATQACAKPPSLRPCSFGCMHSAKLPGY